MVDHHFQYFVLFIWFPFKIYEQPQCTGSQVWVISRKYKILGMLEFVEIGGKWMSEYNSYEMFISINISCICDVFSWGFCQWASWKHSATAATHK